MSSPKSNVICLLKILWDYSDEDNILGMKEIRSKMMQLYGRDIDRRTVTSCCTALNLMGFDISIYEENNKGYYLRERLFDISELRLLMDSVYSNNSIPAKESSKLIKKIKMLTSVNKRKYYNNLEVCRDNAKTSNKETFYNIYLIDEAIAKKKKVSFVYTEYGYDKKLHPKDSRRHIVSPYSMVIYDGNYYLIGSWNGAKEPCHYHISRIKDIQLTDEDIVPLSNDFKLEKYIQNSVFMYGGEPEQIKMRCHKYILDAVINRFGTDIHISKNDDDTFTAILYAAPKGMFIWAMQFLDTCEILEPQSLRDKICRTVKNSPYNK
ncbi:MAG: helix-turn-helix transcriptional regulator [Acutalibacteraceae bacterium]